jgi:glyoxylase-like metal-dependent hydrolase (beta-lactamase superfamily II)
MKILIGIVAALLILPVSVFSAGLDEIAKAMGADKVETIEITGSGFRNAVGQSHHPAKPWPKFNLKSYRLVVNYETASMIAERAITQWENPPYGGGRQPVRGVQKRNSGISGDKGWTLRRGRAGPSRSTAGAHHTLWTTPHGVVKAAQAANAEIKPREAGGKMYKTVSFGKKGVFKALAWFDSKRNLLRGVEADVANPVFGDMRVVTLYSNYKDFGGVKFPTKITTISEGFPSLDLNVTSVKVNVPADITVPDGLRPVRHRVKVDEVADGIFYLTGGSHNSIAIEMKDHVILFEAPLNDGRVNALVKAISETILDKPIRFVVNTHHHFDHSGGLRGMVANGATVVTHEDNVPFYKRIYAKPTRINPDALATSGKRAKFVGVGDKHSMTDGSRTLEIYRLVGSSHNGGLLIGYLPKEKIMIVADAYSGRRARKTPAKKVNPFTANLWENLQRMNLDIETVLPIHGSKRGFEQVRFAAGQE